MRIGSLFSGIGGLELGLDRSGLGHIVWQVEKEEFCRGILAKHWPTVERFEDVREVGANCLSPVDILCGGFPCQDVSSAGKGAGLAGSRSGLWFEYARIIEELAPRWVVVENVASGARRWVDQVQAQLGELGYETIPIPLSAEDVGAPHLRRRIFIIAHATGEPGRRSIRQRKPKVDRGNGRSSANAEREQLRKQPGRGGGTQGQGATEYGQDGTPADANGNGKPALAEYEQVGWVQDFAEDGGWHWRAPCSPVCGSDDASLHRVDRLKALGNAVVPQCAEVIGWMIREMEGTA